MAVAIQEQKIHEFYGEEGLLAKQLG